jgi:hypothetical protein
MKSSLSWKRPAHASPLGLQLFVYTLTFAVRRIWRLDSSTHFPLQQADIDRQDRMWKENASISGWEIK